MKCDKSVTIRNGRPWAIFEVLRSNGFTLMELLVVMVLVGLIGSLLMQGFSYVLQLRVRFLAQLQTQSVRALQSQWIREVIISLTPAQPDDYTPFAGEALRLQGISLSPLMGEKGTPRQVTLEWRRHDKKIVLEYREEGRNPLELGQWTDEGEAGEDVSFVYVDKEGRRHRSWPPDNEKTLQLPQAVFIKVPDLSDPFTLYVSIPGRHDPKPRIEDILK